MTDIILIAILVSFFALAVGFVRLCERIVGPDVESDIQRDVRDEQGIAA